MQHDIIIGSNPSPIGQISPIVIHGKDRNTTSYLLGKSGTGPLFKTNIEARVDCARGAKNLVFLS